MSTRPKLTIFGLLPIYSEVICEVNVVISETNGEKKIIYQLASDSKEITQCGPSVLYSSPHLLFKWISFLSLFFGWILTKSEVSNHNGHLWTTYQLRASSSLTHPPLPPLVFCRRSGTCTTSSWWASGGRRRWRCRTTTWRTSPTARTRRTQVGTWALSGLAHLCQHDRRLVVMEISPSGRAVRMSIRQVASTPPTRDC